jgi:cyclic pyranopterin phosphate synthase
VSCTTFNETDKSRVRVASCGPGNSDGRASRRLAGHEAMTTLATVSPNDLTHVGADGAARMVDVSGKDVTVRVATAAGRFTTTAEVIGLLRRDGLPKGDALAVARIAGIAAAKRTPDLVPLCHPVALHGVTVELELETDSVHITATTRTADRTGVEMEAMTSVVAAGLALYDMVKAVDRAARLTDVRLLAKSGGRSGEWRAGNDS